MGTSEGGGGGSGGEPLRYEFTSQSRFGLSPWCDDYYTYALSQLNLGNNPLSKVEVVSTLNTFNIGPDMYHVNPPYTSENYAPKVYLGTIQMTANKWNFDHQKGINYPSTWPQNSPQKGEDKRFFSI